MSTLENELCADRKHIGDDLRENFNFMLFGLDDRYDETIEPCFLKHFNVDTFEFGNFEMNICFVGIETEANKARSFSIEINEQYQQLVSRQSFRGEFSSKKSEITKLD
jgi:hypothetical protein